MSIRTVCTELTLVFRNDGAGSCSRVFSFVAGRFRLEVAGEAMSH